MHAGDPFVEANRAMEALLVGDISKCAEILAANMEREKSTVMSHGSLGGSSMLEGSQSQISNAPNNALAPVEALLRLYRGQAPEGSLSVMSQSQRPEETTTMPNPWEFTMY